MSGSHTLWLQTSVGTPIDTSRILLAPMPKIRRSLDAVFCCPGDAVRSRYFCRCATTAQPESGLPASYSSAIDQIEHVLPRSWVPRICLPFRRLYAGPCRPEERIYKRCIANFTHPRRLTQQASECLNPPKVSRPKQKMTNNSPEFPLLLNVSHNTYKQNI